MHDRAYPTIFYALDYRSYDTLQKTFPFLPSVVEAVVQT